MFTLKRASYNVGKILFSCILVSLLLGAGGEAWSYTEKDCIRCHKEGSRESSIHIPITEYRASIHGRELTCQDCHTGVKDKNHEQGRGSGTVNCQQCHEQENRHGARSKSDNLPRCYSCHTRHDILPASDPRSSVNPKRLPQTCKTCHPLECGGKDLLSLLVSFRISSHKKQDFSRNYSAGDCLGCHQGKAAHGEKKPVDAQDCYKCHISQNGQSKLLGYIHPDAHADKHPGMFAVAMIYLFLIALLLVGGFMFFAQRFSYKRKGRRR